METDGRQGYPLYAARPQSDLLKECIMNTIFRAAVLTGILSLTACLPVTGGSHESRIQVYKHDGSRQCEAGTSPADMQKELQGIRVYAAEKSELLDKAYPEVCGGETGSINVYTIDTEDRSEAEKRGFKVLQKKD